VDVVKVERLAQSLARFGERMERRLFTEGELAYCRSFSDPLPHLAARFAAKEALLKALGTGLREGISWQDVEVVNNPLGKPELRLTGKARELAERCGARRSFLSLSHDGDVAIAMVVLEGEP
jgi:holo-[acyl-carrier protein] synthase